MPSVRVNDIDLHYEARGNGAETIVFAHGLLWSGGMFEAQMAALSDRYRCIAYDHRGQGQSGIPRTNTITMEQVYEDAVALLDALGIERCHFAGLSMGGFVAMRLAARHPERVASLILLETSADPEPKENVPKYRTLNAIARIGLLRLVASQVMPIMFSRTFLEDPARASERASWLKKLASNDRRIYRAVNGVILREGVGDELSKIRAPTLVIVGEEDVATKPEKAERLARDIAGAKLVRIPAAGHSSCVEQPALVTAAIAEFLGGLTSAT